MQKDYVDYTSHINEEYMTTKRHALSISTKIKDFNLDPIRANTALIGARGFATTKNSSIASRGYSSMANSPFSSPQNSIADIQPGVLENKIADS